MTHTEHLWQSVASRMELRGAYLLDPGILNIQFRYLLEPENFSKFKL